MGSGLLTPLSSISPQLTYCFLALHSMLVKNGQSLINFSDLLFPLQMDRHISLHMDQKFKEDRSATTGGTTTEEIC